MDETIKTARLFLRPYAPTDAPALFGFMRDALSMQHTYVAPSLEHCRARLAVYEASRTRLGFAPWVARSSEEGKPIGWGGLSEDPEEPAWGLEVSYAFAPAVWGRGFATELVQSSLEFAFGRLAAAEVHGFAKPQNTGSVRVLQKCGFCHLRFEPRLQRDHYLVHATALNGPRATMPGW